MSSRILPHAERPDAMPVLWRLVEETLPAPPPSEEEEDAIAAEGERQVALRVEQARQEGFATGIRQAEQQFLPAIDNLARTLTELAAMRENIREETIPDLVKLALTICARVIHRELSIDPDALAGLVKAAFSKIQSREIHRVRMHPALEALVVRCLEQAGSPKNLVLNADPSMSPGQLIFETAQGALDSSVDTILGEIERGLIDKLER